MKYTSCPIGTILHWGKEETLKNNRYKVIKGNALVAMLEGGYVYEIY